MRVSRKREENHRPGEVPSTDTMDAGLRDLLDELHEWGREHDERQRRHLNRLHNLEPGTAVLVRSSGRTRLLGIGISNGYSTIWLTWSTVWPVGGSSASSWTRAGRGWQTRTCAVPG